MAHHPQRRDISNLPISWPILDPAGQDQTSSLDSRSIREGLKSANSQCLETESGGEGSSVWSDLKRWTVDLVSCFVACLALMAIVVTLATHDGRTLPNWRFGITVNALVSIFAVIWRAAMVAPVTNAISQLKWSWFQNPRPLMDLVRFDQASRGVVGSLWFVGRHAGMHLAWVGGIICVLSIASDPFIQQVVKYNSCQQAVPDSSASVERTNIYAVIAQHTGAEQAALDYATQAALYEGVYNLGTAVQPTCPTGNCTFPIWNTIGMCSGCTDISHDLTTHCTVTTIDGTQQKACNWTLPSGLRLTVPADQLKNMIVRSENLALDATPISEKGIVSSTQIITLTGNQSYDGDAGDFWLWRGTGETNQSAMAVQCSLRPCIQTYSTVVSNGQASDQLLSTHNMTFNGTSIYGGFVAAPMPCLINGTYHDASNFTKPPDDTVSDHDSYIPVQRPFHNNETLWLPPQCRFSYPYPIGLVEYLIDFLSGEVGWGDYVLYATPSWMGPMFRGDDTNFEVVNATWASIATSLTAHMRRVGCGDKGGDGGLDDLDDFGPGAAIASAPISGHVWTTATCINVQWPWLAYPAVLLLMTVVLLFSTVVVSVRKSSGMIWKASPLPLLFYGLDEELRRVVRRELGSGRSGRDAGGSRAMEQLAKRVMVSLQVEENGSGEEQGFVGFIEEKS